ncbi:hypothetical protein [Olsenella sp. DNF00959]|uniref:hypothetical protein n=1 Tax=Olsenella sp. DNF00959 TaxID=1476999 RepID=UPI001E6161A3|nr:hypothetical protein [Olsenella sp. DNF00959]
MDRHATNVVKGFRTIDGGGVSLVRVLGNQTADAFDPFLMLDSFDSTTPTTTPPASPSTRTAASRPSPTSARAACTTATAWATRTR